MYTYTDVVTLYYARVYYITYILNLEVYTSTYDFRYSWKTRRVESSSDIQLTHEFVSLIFQNTYVYYTPNKLYML